MPKKILFINQETEPFIEGSHMASMGKLLPEGCQEGGYEIRTFMPKWGTINERRGQLHEVIRLSGMNIVIDDNDYPLLIKVASIPVSRVQVYFIDNEYYFNSRRTEVNEQGEEYADNGQRAIFFARGVLETVKKLRWKPDIIVCQGWMGAVVPLYVKTVYADEPWFADAKVVTSLFCEHLTKEMGTSFKRCVTFREVTQDTLKPYKDNFDFFELGKLAIDFSDGITIAAPGINQELLAYSKDKLLPVMDYPGEEFVASCKAFFEDLTK